MITTIYIYIYIAISTSHIRRAAQICRGRWTVQPRLLVYTQTHAAIGDVNGSVSGTDEYDERVLMKRLICRVGEK